jgi:hypothetical protein
MEGFCVMLHQLTCDKSSIEAVEWMLHKPIKAVMVDAGANDGNGCLRFEFDGGAVDLYDAGQSCCESRYMKCDDDLAQFAGAEVVSVEVRDGPTEKAEYDQDHETCFLHVNTNRGTIVACCHNEHNGYYGGFALEASLVRR